MKVLVVVPTYNERENVGPLVREILAQGEGIDVCVADDGSPDGTGDAVRAPWREFPGRVELLDRGEKGGRGAAVIAAFKKGLADPKRYDVFFEMDADFSHHPREIPKFLQKLETHDMVIGSRYVEGGGSSEWGVARPLLSWAGQQVHQAGGGRAGARHHQRLPRLPARGAGAGGLRPHQDQGLRGARRDGLPGLGARVPPGRGADPLQEPRARRVQALRGGDLHGAPQLRAAALPLRVPSEEARRRPRRRAR